MRQILIYFLLCNFLSVIGQHRIYWIKNDQELLFDATRGGDSEILTFDITNSKLVNLTDNNSFDGEIQITSDKDFMIFSSDRSGLYQIYRMNINGKNLVNLTNSERNELMPKLSPDGSLIAFSSTGNDFSQVYVVDFEGINLKKITNSSYPVIVQGWAKDNSQLIIVEEPIFKNRQMWGNPTTGDFSEPFPNGTSPSKILTWWNGDRYLYQKISDWGGASLYSLDQSTNENKLLCKGLPMISSIQINPVDSSRILVLTTQYPQMLKDVYLIKIDSKKPLKIGSNFEQFGWSSDGSQIALRKGNHLAIANSEGEIVKVLVE